MVPLVGSISDFASDIATVARARSFRAGIAAVVLLGLLLLNGGPVVAEGFDFNAFIGVIERALKESQEQSAPEDTPPARDQVTDEPSQVEGGEATAAPAPAPADQTPIAPAPQVSNGSLMPMGDEQTAKAQALLTQLGFDPGPVDGVSGRRTRTAIQEFQVQQGLPPDGQVSLGLLAALESAAASAGGMQISAADQSASQRDIASALEELGWAIDEKIDHDVETVAQAFSDAYEIQQSRRVADFLTAPLAVIKQAISLVSAAKNLPELLATLDQAESLLSVVSIFAGISQLQEAGGRLQLALDGPAYGSLLDEMLKEAAGAAATGGYATEVTLQLAGVGNRKSPIWARHRAGEDWKLVWGSRAVKREIAAQIDLLTKELAGRPAAAFASADAVLSELTKVTAAIKRSKQGEVTVAVGATPDAVASSGINLGSIGALEQVRTKALGFYDSELRFEQSVVITSAIEAGAQAIVLHVGYKSPTGEELGAAVREVFTPLSVYQTQFEKIYTSGAPEQIRGLPHEMLLALPAELSNVWNATDDAVNVVRSALSPPTQVSEKPQSIAAVESGPTGPVRADGPKKSMRELMGEKYSYVGKDGSIGWQWFKKATSTYACKEFGSGGFLHAQTDQVCEPMTCLPIIAFHSDFLECRDVKKVQVAATAAESVTTAAPIVACKKYDDYKQTVEKQDCDGALHGADWERVQRFCLPLAEAGEAQPQVWLGEAYLEGKWGAPRDEIQALSWFQRAAAQNEYGALLHLRAMYAQDIFNAKFERLQRVQPDKILAYFLSAIIEAQDPRDRTFEGTTFREEFEKELATSELKEAQTLVRAQFERCSWPLPWWLK